MAYTSKYTGGQIEEKLDEIFASKLQEKAVEIVDNGATEVSADEGFLGLGKVSINVNVPTGGGSALVSPKDVNFRDYDGTILYSYTKDAFLALAEMPTLPTRQGLTCQGWNYNMEDAKAYVEEYGKLDVGATYITDDGKTRLYITIAAEGRMDVPLYLKQSVAKGVVIDWGDGSATEKVNSTTINITHHYDNIGDYVITLDVVNGLLSLIGRQTYNNIMGETKTAYSNMLKRIDIGNGVTSIGDYIFQNCHSLASIVIPNSVTSIGNNAFYNCYSLASIVIPNSATSIGSQAFYGCSGMVFYDFRTHTSVPTLLSTNAFSLIASDCKIVVPDALYDTWIAETNWSSSSVSKYIVKASEFNG
jgi:hypothetical protein